MSGSVHVANRTRPRSTACRAPTRVHGVCVWDVTTDQQQHYCGRCRGNCELCAMLVFVNWHHYALPYTVSLCTRSAYVVEDEDYIIKERNGVLPLSASALYVLYG